MSDWFNYPQNGASSLIRPWWRFLNDRQILTDPITSVPRVQFGRDDGYTVTRNDLDTEYLGLDVFGVPAVLPGLNSEDVETDIDISFPRPTPGPLVGQVWVINDGGVRRDLMVVRIDYPGGIANVWMGLDYIPVGMGPQHDHSEIAPYVEGVNWPPPDAVLVAGPGSPWSPIPIPVIP